jgi:hypothetical protein
MKDFITKLKKYEGLFLYNYASYDKNSHKLKVYYFSPDQDHHYLSVDLGKNSSECEIGSLILMNNRVFEDNPISKFELSAKNKKDFIEYHKRKESWENRFIQDINTVFSSKNLTL